MPEFVSHGGIEGLAQRKATPVKGLAIQQFVDIKIFRVG